MWRVTVALEAACQEASLWRAGATRAVRGGRKERRASRRRERMALFGEIGVYARGIGGR